MARASEANRTQRPAVVRVREPCSVTHRPDFAPPTRARRTPSRVRNPRRGDNRRGRRGRHPTRDLDGQRSARQSDDTVRCAGRHAFPRPRSTWRAPLRPRCTPPALHHAYRIHFRTTRAILRDFPGSYVVWQRLARAPSRGPAFRGRYDVRWFGRAAEQVHSNPEASGARSSARNALTRCRRNTSCGTTRTPRALRPSDSPGGSDTPHRTERARAESRAGAQAR